MDHSSAQNPVSEVNARIAAPLHTVLVLAAIAAYTVAGKIRSLGLPSATGSNRIALYERTLVFEWLLLAFVLYGVHLHGSRLQAVVGQRWQSAVGALKDIGIGCVFFLITTLLASTIGPYFGGGTPEKILRLMLPTSPAEKFLWLAVSTTAGICEEAVYRGYLQRQLAALTDNSAIGIALSAVIFGTVHAYQGARMVLQISLLGALLGVLAHWRKTTRPGMISHIVQDSLAVFINH